MQESWGKKVVGPAEAVQKRTISHTSAKTAANLGVGVLSELRFNPAGCPIPC